MRTLTRPCVLSLAAACACLALMAAHAQKPQRDVEQKAGAARLYPVMVNFKWGYIDRTGKLVTELKYDQESRFGDGYAVVMSGLLAVDYEKAEPVGGMVAVPVGPEGIKWEIIDAAGKAVVRLPNDRHYVGSGFSEGLALFSVWQLGRGSVYGYMDTAGRVVVEPQFITAGYFREGLADVCKDYGRCGYIDRSGKFVVPPKYKETHPFSEGLGALITQDELLGFVDKAGEFVIPPRFGALATQGFVGGLAPVGVAGSDRFGYIDKLGGFQIQPAFEAAGSFSEELAPAMSGGKWGYIDRSGKFVIQPLFTAAGSFSEGLAHASTSDCVFAATRGDDSPCGYGYIDKTGKFVVEQRFDYAEPFRDGVAHVIEHGGRGYIDREGKFIWNPSK
ncbi:MAG TPA: WG repeat-containing protein [Pyrinomonadaceae bacterium]